MPKEESDDGDAIAPRLPSRTQKTETTKVAAPLRAKAAGKHQHKPLNTNEASKGMPDDAFASFMTDKEETTTSRGETAPGAYPSSGGSTFKRGKECHFPVPADEGEMCPRSFKEPVEHEAIGGDFSSNQTTTANISNNKRGYNKGLRGKDVGGGGSVGSSSSTPAALDDNSATRPGAVAVEGLGVNSGRSDLQLYTDPDHTAVIAAEVVDDDVDVEARVEAKLREREGILEQEVQQRLINQAARASVVGVADGGGDLDSETKQSSRSPEQNRRKWWIGGGLLLLVMVAVAVALGVTLSNNNNDPAGLPSTPPPTLSPAVARLETLTERLVGVFGNSLLDEASVQFETLTWLANGDPAMLPADSTPLSTLINRFVAALLYFGGSGSGWNQQHQFLTASSVCAWNNGNDEGIFCNTEESVIGIRLPGNNIVGNLPMGDLAKLENLTILDLSKNSISGSIPAQLGNLPLLNLVDVRSNALGGSIPGSLGNLSSLEFLVLDGNGLTGSIPYSIHQLPNLRTLSLASNSLNGTIPPFNGANALANAFYQENSLVGSIPSSIGLLPLLEVFVVAKNNGLNGTIPPFSGNGGSLRMFDVSSNRLTGGMDAFIMSVRNTPLEQLVVETNELGGTISTVIGELTTLQALDLGFNRFSGTLATELGLLTNLVDNLYLHTNQFTGTLPTEIGGLTELRSLDFGPNLLNGTIPTEYGRLTALTFFDVNSNMITGTLPSELGNLVNLTTASFAFNMIEGTAPLTYRSWVPKLEFLLLDGNNITGNLNPVFCSTNSTNTSAGNTTNSTPPIETFRADCWFEVVCDCCTLCCIDEFDACFFNQ